MQDIDGGIKANGVDGSKGVGVEIINQFNGAASETLQRLGGWRMLSRLREEQRKAKTVLREILNSPCGSNLSIEGVGWGDAIVPSLLTMS